jgi:hypothetical protein
MMCARGVAGTASRMGRVMARAIILNYGIEPARCGPRGPVNGKRLRGWFLRLALNRPLSVCLGLLLLAPAVWLFFGDYRWETPVTDGVQLILGATGAALLFAGIGGRRPDWIDE